MPPLQSALLVDKDRSDSERQSPEAQPTAIDRRSETENILQMAESALSVESREARESYTIQVHSFKTRTKAEQVVAHY
jgi:cell division protein FtsN